MIAVSSPYPLTHFKGNSVSANRIAQVVNGTAVHGEPPANATCLIAIHARRSGEVIKNFAGRGPLIVNLAGTDLYRDVPAGDPVSFRSMELADVLTVAQDSSVNDVPAQFRDKVRVCRKSVNLSLPDPRPKRESDLITQVNHLRHVKDPFLPLEAIDLGDHDCRLVHIGGALNEGMKDRAIEESDRRENYEWLGNIPREKVLDWLCRSRVTINPALMEGGSNAVAEAIMCGTPVLASDIPGNRGMLGSDYPGYFPVGDSSSLSKLISRVLSEDPFTSELQSAVMARQPLFTAEQERASWAAVLAEVGVED